MTNIQQFVKAVQRCSIEKNLIHFKCNILNQVEDTRVIPVLLIDNGVCISLQVILYSAFATY